MTTAFTNHQDLGPSSTATLLFRQKCWRVPTLHHCRGEIQELQTLTAMPSTAAVVEKRELAATDVPWPWDVTFTHWSSWPVRVTNNDTLPPHSHDIPGPAFLCHLVPLTLPSNVEIFWCKIIPDQVSKVSTSKTGCVSKRKWVPSWSVSLQQNVKGTIGRGRGYMTNPTANHRGSAVEVLEMHLHEGSFIWESCQIYSSWHDN